MAAEYGIPLAIGTVGTWIVGTMFSKDDYSSQGGPGQYYNQSSSWFGNDQYSPQSSSWFGNDQYSRPSSSWFGNDQYYPPSSSWFGPSEPQRPSSSWFGPSEPQRPSSSWFGPSEPQRPYSSWFGPSEPQRPSSSWFGTKQPSPPVEPTPPPPESVPEPTLPPPEPFPEPTPATPGPFPEPTPATPGPFPEPTPATPEPFPEPTPATPGPFPEPTPATPGPFPEPTPATPEPTPGFQRISAWTDSECREYLTKFKITDKQSFRRWMVRNHPDRGGDDQIFANVSACFKRIIPQDPPSNGPNTPQNEPENPYPSNGPNVPADEPDTQPTRSTDTPQNELDIRSDLYRPIDARPTGLADASRNEPDIPPNPYRSNGPNIPADEPDSPPETTTEDCRDTNLYFENTAGGDCLFESVAQIYHPVDIRSRDSAGYQPVLDTATKLRLKLANTYRDASRSNLFRTAFSIPKSITDINNRVISLSEYANKIQIPRTWGTDTDLEVMSRLLKIPFRVIEHSDGGNTIVRDISGPGVTPSENEYYTICNIDNQHWVLKKHNRPLTLPNL